MGLSISSYFSVLSSYRFRTYVSMKGCREFCIFYTTPVGFTKVIWVFQYPVILGVRESIKVLKDVSRIFFSANYFLSW